MNGKWNEISISETDSHLMEKKEISDLNTPQNVLLKL
jgi:hypothetical protein